MTVKEYAESVSLSVAEILKKCEQLGIEVKTGDDILEDDDVISLDYATNLISSDSESTYEEEDSMDSLVEDLVASTNVHTMNPETKKQKLKKRSEIESSKSEYFHKRKEMYKHKEKLMNNQVNEDIVLYKNDMTVADLADALKISGTDIIKKLMGLGLMVSLNQPIDFQTAEIITLDYGKSLKKEETQDISNFEEYEVTDQESDLVLRPVINIRSDVSVSGLGTMEKPYTFS